MNPNRGPDHAGCSTLARCPTVNDFYRKIVMIAESENTLSVC